MDLSETPVADLKPYKQNARTHSPEQVRQIVKSIEQFGFTNPVLTDGKNRIVAGHGRVMAAKEMGLPTVPTIPLSHLTKAQVRAYVIADNKLAMNAGWDEQILAEELKGIDDSEIDIDLTGFSEDEIAELLKEEPAGSSEEDDNVPETPQNIFNVERGQIWQLGDHRLMCGDCTDKGDVDRLMDRAKADMVFTDPPYGVNFKQGQFVPEYKRSKVDRNFSSIQNDELKGDALSEFITKVLNNFPYDCIFYVWSPPMMEGHSILKGCLDSGIHMQSQLIWYKKPFVLGICDHHWQHEVCWYGYRGKKHQWFGGRDKGTIIEQNRTMSSNLHPTMKPVELGTYAITNSTKKGQIVSDIFLGSGSTLIACEKTGRKCYGMEIDPHYCSVIINRWQEFTGKTAEPVDAG